MLKLIQNINSMLVLRYLFHIEISESAAKGNLQIRTKSHLSIPWTNCLNTFFVPQKAYFPMAEFYLILFILVNSSPYL